MGGGRNGDFGNTFDKIMNKLGIDAKDGLSLDEISTILSWASFIPGLDAAVDIVSIPVDLIRGDYMSAMFDVVGIVPFVGEIGDTAKFARVTDKAVDIRKATKTTTNFKSFSKKIHIGKQGKHILGHNNYQKGKSILNISTGDAQKLINKYSGTGRKIGTNRETVNFKKVIGKYVDPKTGKAYDTTVGTIHYSQSGTHLVPDKPASWRK